MKTTTLMMTEYACMLLLHIDSNCLILNICIFLRNSNMLKITACKQASSYNEHVNYFGKLHVTKQQ